MKLDLKLLCMALGLVFCVGQSAEVTPCDHAGATDDKKCQGKRGGALALKAHGATGQDNVNWMKEGSTPETITPGAGKYAKSEPNEAVLTILNLNGDSEGKYTASGAGISTKQTFIVQVADCFGGATDVTCDGEATGELWLKAIGPAKSDVTWTKEGPTPTVIEDETGKYKKTGGFKSTLKILNLGKESQGTYVATDGSIAPAKQKFTVQVPAIKASDDDGGDDDGGDDSGGDDSGGKGNVAGAGKGNVTVGGGKGNSGGKGNDRGGGNGLSYSPALLVIVTLVQLLLQLAN